MPGRCIQRLKPCQSQARRISSASRRQPSAHARELKGNDLGPTRGDAHQTFRVRKDGSSKELPLPPLLDPVVLESRSRFEQTKTRPVIEELTPFQKKLWKNPFAHALASPVRTCRVLQINLPVAFLTSLHARPHPTTDDPWLLPLSLTTDDKHLGLPYRFIVRKPVVQLLGTKKNWEKGIYGGMVEKLGSDRIKKMVWREDMPDIIRDLMRKRLTNKLRWNFGFRGRLIPVGSPKTEHIEDVEDVSCVLTFKTLRTRADELHDRCDEITAELEKWSAYFRNSFGSRYDPHASPSTTHNSPSWYTQPLVPHMKPRLRYPELEFNTTIWRGKKIAVYSLSDLLGEDLAQQLIQGSKYEEGECVAMKSARHNVPVEILLMQMQAYLARTGP